MTQNPAPVPRASGRLTSMGTAEFSGIDATILMGGDGKPFTVMEMIVRPGMGAPAHISFHEDKVFHISEGNFLFLIGEDRIKAKAGDHLFAGRRQVHSFSALGSKPARMTLVSNPAHHDRFFRALSALPVPHDPKEVEAVCETCDQRIVGPIVEA
nr:cupin domain-containing protein [Marinicella sp. W31]MDC2875541.1 cupin domain-containing protein [Marinicella sp. W31]